MSSFRYGSGDRRVDRRETPYRVEDEVSLLSSVVSPVTSDSGREVPVGRCVRPTVSVSCGRRGRKGPEGEVGQYLPVYWVRPGLS